jgi:ABC-type lipoprotein release transport system permease subunit
MGSVAVNIAIDNYIRKSGMIVSILNFGLVQVLLMLGIAVVIAFLATIYPVYSYSKKKPVEVINRIL